LTQFTSTKQNTILYEVDNAPGNAKPDRHQLGPHNNNSYSNHIIDTDSQQLNFDDPTDI